MKAAPFTLALVACSHHGPPPRPIAEEFVSVGYPPPPAEVEVTERALAGRPDCKWLDGHYEWRGRRWFWTPGSFAIPPADCSYAPPAMHWGQGPNAELYYAPPRWYRADGKTPCDPPKACLAEKARE